MIRFCQVFRFVLAPKIGKRYLSLDKLAQKEELNRVSSKKTNKKWRENAKHLERKQNVLAAIKEVKGGLALATRLNIDFEVDYVDYR